MSVRCTRDDLDRISSHLAARNRAAAVALLDAVQAVATRLDQFPHSAQETEMPGIRAAPVLRLPYVVFNTVERHGVTVHYIRHAARLRPWDDP